MMLAANRNNNWKSQKLEELCAQITDGKHGDCENEPNSGFFFLSCKDVVESKLNYEAARQITEADFLDTHRRTKFAPSDILITNSGTIGRMALAPDNDLTRRTTFQKSVAILKPLVTRVEPVFLYYAIQSDIRRLIEFAGGTAQKNLLLGDLREYRVNVPPLPMQRRIGEVLFAYDELIENNARRIKILEEMAKLVYRDWFAEFKAPGVRLRKATPEEKKVTGKDVFPEGWRLKCLGEIAQETRRAVDPAEINADTPYLGLEHMPRQSIALDSWGKAKQVQSTKLAFNKGEILFGKIRPYFHKVGVAPVDGVCSSDIIVIVPVRAEFSAHVLSCVSSTEFVNHATQTSQGTKMPRANWDILLRYPIVIPPEKLLTKFNDTIWTHVRLILDLAIMNQNLRQTRDLLLPKLVSGEVEV